MSKEKSVSEEIFYRAKRIYPLRYMDGHVEWRVTEPSNAAFYEKLGSEAEAKAYIDAGCPGEWHNSPQRSAWLKQHDAA